MTGDGNQVIAVKTKTYDIKRRILLSRRFKLDAFDRLTRQRRRFDIFDEGVYKRFGRENF